MTGIPAVVMQAAEQAEKRVMAQDAPQKVQPPQVEEPKQSDPSNAQSAPPVKTEAAPEAQPQAKTTDKPARSVEELQAEVDRLAQSNTVLRTKYDAEVPRYAQELRQLRDMNARLMEEQAQRAQQPVAQPSSSPEAEKSQFDPNAINLKSHFSEDAIDTFGEEMLRELLSAQYKVLTPELSNVQKTLEAERLENKRLREELSQDSEQAFVNMVYERAPALRTLNHDEGFNDWLDQPLSDVGRYTRRDAFTDAYNSRDIATLIKISSQYDPAIASLGANETLPTYTPLESQVVAPAEGSVVSPQPPEKKVYTGAEYKHLMNQALFMTGQPRAELIKELDLAVSEGRVTR